MTIELQRRTFTVAEFNQLGTTGVIGEDERVELIEGEIIAMAPIGPSHAGFVDLLNARFSAQIGSRAIVRVQSPLHLSSLSEPQPDLMLLRPRADFYTGSHPVPADVLLIVEVAESSLAYDREIKVPLYAAAGIPEVWVIDTATRTTHVFAGPSGGVFEQERVVERGDSVSPRAFPDVAIGLGDVGG